MLTTLSMLQMMRLESGTGILDTYLALAGTAENQLVT